MTDLERVLARADVDWPRADVSAGVIGRIESGPVQPQVPRWALAIAVATAAAVLLMVTPGGRGLVANVLEVAGVTVMWGEVTPGSELDLGRESTLEEATESVMFPLLIPSEPPDAVFTGPDVVHMTWRGDDEIPSAPGSSVATLLSQYEGDLFDDATKVLSGESDVTFLQLRGHEALWIEGAPHAVELAGQETRLAANVLIWEEAGVVGRIETTGGLEDAVALAESLR